MSPFRSGELRVVSLNYNEQFTKIHIFLVSKTAVFIRKLSGNSDEGAVVKSPLDWTMSMRLSTLLMQYSYDKMGL